jgi:hypothetical protein
VVSWNGLSLPTRFVNSGRLTAQVPGSAITKAGTVVVFVFNPPGGTTFVFGFTANNGCGGGSQAVSFTVT